MDLELVNGLKSSLTTIWDWFLSHNMQRNKVVVWIYRLDLSLKENIETKDFCIFLGYISIIEGLKPDVRNLLFATKTTQYYLLWLRCSNLQKR